MSNKVTSIYIDTTGFCDEAMARVKNAFNDIVEHNGVDGRVPRSCIGIVAFDEYGEWQYLEPECAKRHFKKVGPWELESIALRCKQEKKEEAMPARNIYIDARKLTQEERLNAYKAIADTAGGKLCGWSPAKLASDRKDDSSLTLFDVFAIDADGDRRFYSGYRIDDMKSHIENPKEITYDQLMSLTR